MHSHCDYGPYYCQQAGSGINVYKGLPHQRGHGVSALFKRYGIPLLKYIAKTGFRFGKQVGEDVFLNRDNPKEALKRRLKSLGKEVATDALDNLQTRVSQIGSGVTTRKRRKKSYRKIKSATKRKTIKRRTVTKRRATKSVSRKRVTKKAKRNRTIKSSKSVIFGY